MGSSFSKSENGGGEIAQPILTNKNGGGVYVLGI